MRLKPRLNHLGTYEGIVFHALPAIALLIAALAFYRTLDQPLGTAPLVEERKVVPAFGEQGFKVDLFCADPLTTVTKNLFAPVDSPFSASYTLDRTKQGIHETVIVNVYPEPERQPVGTYMEDQDAFVNKDAIKCIEDKVR